MNSLKVLVLVHEEMIPPEKASFKTVDWADWKTEYYVRKTLVDLGHDVKVLGLNSDLEVLRNEIEDFSPDIIFNLLEEFADDPEQVQNIVSYLELKNLAYTGCSPQGLSLGRDKSLTKKVLNYHGILTPKFFVVQKGEKVKIPKEMKYPMIVKSLVEEASMGISQDSVVKSEEKLVARIEFIHNSLGTPALVEEYIDGKELYVGVLGNKNTKVLPPWEVHFGSLKEKGYPIATEKVKFSKSYSKKHGIRRGPVKGLSDKTLREIEKLSRAAYKSLNLNGYARMDLRVTKEGEIYFLEVNPNPELAFGECLANAAKFSGMSYENLIGKILNLGLSWKKAS